MGFDLSNYEEVKDRIPRFWKEHPGGAIRTSVLPSPAGEWVVHAALFRAGEEGPFATGLAHEVSGSRGVNATSALENCETSAIGRALANGGFSSGKNRPSREEMGKAKAREGSNLAPDATLPAGGTPVAKPGKDPYAQHKQAVLKAIQAEYPGMDADEQKRLALKHWPAALDAAGDPSLETPKPGLVADKALALVRLEAPFT